MGCNTVLPVESFGFFPLLLSSYSVISFRFLAIFQFHEDRRDLFHVCLNLNIIFGMLGSCTVLYYVQTQFGTVCRLSEAVIIQLAIDSFCLRWKMILKVVFIIVCGPFHIFLGVTVCSMGIPVLPIQTSTSIIFLRSGQVCLTQSL